MTRRLRKSTGDVMHRQRAAKIKAGDVRAKRLERKAKYEAGELAKCGGYEVRT